MSWSDGSSDAARLGDDVSENDGSSTRARFCIMNADTAVAGWLGTGEERWELGE